jgi:cell division septum initiation protein DivIVA
MAEKLGFWFRDSDALQADAINANAEALESVELSVSRLQEIVERQQKEIVQLRAMIMGLADVLDSKVPFDDAELECAVRTAMERLVPPPPKPEDAAATANALLKVAQDHHQAKRFDEAREAYRELARRYPGTTQAAVALQQLGNL